MYNTASKHRMFSLVLLLLIDTCLGYNFGPPYAICTSFSTGHPSTSKDGTVTISLLKQGLARSCYTPGETYTVQVTGNKQFNGIILQANSGVLTVSNNPQKLANGPCDYNTVSHRAKLQTSSVNFSFVAPPVSGVAKVVTLRYAIVFSYTESLENKYSSFSVCRPPAVQPSASLATPVTSRSQGASTPTAPVLVTTFGVKVPLTTGTTLAVSSTSTSVTVLASRAPTPTPSPSAIPLSQAVADTPNPAVLPSPTPDIPVADKCNTSFYMTDERQKYVYPDDGMTYDCALKELLRQPSCETTCDSSGKAICCEYGRPTNVTRQFQCINTNTFAEITVYLPVVRYVRCIPSGDSDVRKK